MGYLLKRTSTSRIALFDSSGETLEGLMLLPLESETAQSFSHGYGPLHNSKECLNIGEFPELSRVEYFIIEHLTEAEKQTVLRQCPP
jgi:hypothetical protein